MRTIRLTNFGFALFCLFLSNAIAWGQPPAQNQPTQSRKGYCKAWSSDQVKIYFSDVFESDVTSNVILNRGIENLFEAYLKQLYGYSSTPITPVVCVLSAQSVVVAEEGKKQEQALYTMKGNQLIETRWKLSQQQATALAALPTTPPCYEHDANNPDCQQTGSPAAPKPTLYEVCRVVTSVQTAGKRTTYFSDVMPRANINEADYAAAFAAFLAKKYGVQGISPDPSMCGTVPSQAEGKKLVEEGWWKVNPYFSTSVQTGWTYSPASPPASPAPAASAAPVRPAPNVSAAPVPPTQPPTTTAQSATSQPGAAAGASAPPSRYGLCYASADTHTAYFSAPFKVADGDYSKWQQAFGTFLQKNYHYGSVVGCYRESSLAEAQSEMKMLEDTFRPTRKIVETDWKYQ